MTFILIIDKKIFYFRFLFFREATDAMYAIFVADVDEVSYYFVTLYAKEIFVFLDDLEIFGC